MKDYNNYTLDQMWINSIISYNEHKVSEMIDDGYNIDMKLDFEFNQNFETALSYAAFLKSDNLIKLLIDNGAEINTIDSYNNTPLMKYSFNTKKKKSYDILDLLIDNTSDEYLFKENKNNNNMFIDFLHYPFNDLVKENHPDVYKKYIRIKEKNKNVKKFNL
jgi:ankyrin repeat protein